MAKQNLQRKRWWRGDVWAVTKDGIERLDGRYFVKALSVMDQFQRGTVAFGVRPSNQVPQTLPDFRLRELTPA